VTSILASAFRAIGCEAPRVTAVAAPGRVRDTLLATGRFLTVVRNRRSISAQRFPSSRSCP
jgi:hypothetical protein